MFAFMFKMQKWWQWRNKKINRRISTMKEIKVETEVNSDIHTSIFFKRRKIFID